MFKNIALSIALVLMFTLVFITAIHSIDNITKRDCDRGIVTACKYINQ